jgi:hypothetical protein
MSKAKKTKRNPHMGGTLDDFLTEEGIYEAVQTTAMKRILAMQLAEAMKERNLTKVEMVRRLPAGHRHARHLGEHDRWREGRAAHQLDARGVAGCGLYPYRRDPAASAAQ